MINKWGGGGVNYCNYFAIYTCNKYYVLHLKYTQFYVNCISTKHVRLRFTGKVKYATKYKINAILYVESSIFIMKFSIIIKIKFPQM